jgi:hypothetical protein
MSGIFISYRREDSGGYAGRIFAWLGGKIGADRVFMDIHGIALGEDFVAAVHRKISSSRVLLAIIGPRWSTITDDQGRSRISQADDLVAIEIEAALHLKIAVIPVLVGGAKVPRPHDLPPKLTDLAFRNGIEISDKFFDQNMEYLAAQLRESGVAFGGAAGARLETPHPDSVDAPVGRLKRKVCMLGAAGVGKTSLVSRFVHSVFRDSYLTTVGVAISKKTVNVGTTEVSMSIWDIAGEEDGAPVKLNQVRGAHGLILVADGCHLLTLDVAESIRRRFFTEAGVCPTVLAVNKVDLFDEWEVKMEVLEYQSRNGLTTFTTSAKTGKGVEQMFTHLARMMVTAAAGEEDEEE